MTPLKTYYPNGQLECDGFIDGDVQVGFWKFYRDNGTLFSTGEFDLRGQPVGVWSEYHENGQIKYEAISPRGNNFNLSDQSLELLNYWSETGIQMIVDGNGTLKLFFENGNLQHVSHWNKGRQVESLMEFFENGAIRFEHQFVNGVRHGSCKVYHDSGILVYDALHVNGVRSGPCFEWYESGQLQEEGQFIDDTYYVLNFWNADGEKLLSHGTGIAIREYGAEGLDVYEETYERGRLTSERKIRSRGYSVFKPNGDDPAFQ